MINYLCPLLYVLNVKRMAVDGEVVRLQTNYTTMRSQFALYRWTSQLQSEKSSLLLQNVLPIGGAMVLETADDQILMEERGKVEFPGKYMVAPAGGCETRDWRVLPEPFRSIQGEAWEETALLPGKDYGIVSLLGIARGRVGDVNPTFVYSTISNCPLDEIKERANNFAPEAGEHQRLFGIQSEMISDFCVHNVERITKSGFGALLIFGDHKFGQEWFSKTIRMFRQYCGWTIQYSRESFP